MRPTGPCRRRVTTRRRHGPSRPSRPRTDTGPSNGRILNASTCSSSAPQLALAHPQADALDQPVDAPRRDAAHIGLLDHRQQCLLRAAARLQDAREIAALTGSWESAARSHRRACPTAAADSRCDASRDPAADAHHARPDQLGHLELHQLRGDRLDGSRITSACSSSSTFLTTSSIVILSAAVPRRLLSSNLQQVRRSSASRRPEPRSVRSRPTPRYGT
jgi:hypothetical protein